MNLFLLILLFLAGLVLIVKGADWLTDGASAVARRFGIPSIIVGLTIVAIGTSMPEFVVSAVGAMNGNADIALGNVVGSNIFNILAIAGITAIVTPIVVERSSVLYDVPFCVLASVVLSITTLDTIIDPTQTENIVSRSDGLLLLCLLVIFIYYTISAAKTLPHSDDAATTTPTPVWKAVMLICIGLVALIIGGDLLVDGASGIARQLGIGEALIALTIVSWGTSAPELAASVAAARKGETGMALGNVVGSNVFNTFFVMGTAAVIQPIHVMGITLTDILTLLGASLLLWLFCYFGKTHYTVTRSEAAVMLLCAAVYYGWTICCAL